jgi:two-component system, response regulator
MEREDSSLIVLMADDDEDDCHLVESAFQEMRIAHDLRSVVDGKELLDYLYNKGDFADPEKFPRPNLILLDLNMPRIDGREALKKIKSDPKLSDISILILTTSTEDRDIVFSRQAGASSFLIKTVDFEELAKILEKFCVAIVNDPNIPFQVIGC